MDCTESKSPPFEQRRVFRDLHAEIEALVSETTLVTLNAAAGKRLGTQAVQLFVATARALEMNGGRLAIFDATPPFAKPMPTLVFSPTSTPGAL